MSQVLITSVTLKTQKEQKRFLRGWLSLGHEILLKSDERELLNVKYI